jgi:hypothetical protein
MCNCNNSLITTTTCTCGCATPCPTSTDCDCPVKLVSDCVTFNGDNLAVSGIESGQDLTATLTQLDAYIGTAITQVSNAFSLINVGDGFGMYSGIDALGRKKLKSITTTGDLILVVNNTNDINFSIDEAELITFIQANVGANGLNGTTNFIPLFNSSSTATDSAIEQTAVGGRILIGATDNGVDSLQVDGGVEALAFKTVGGIPTQFLKADGTMDSTGYAPLAYPAFTGIPTAPTASVGTNTTQIATTAFVSAAASSGTFTPTYTAVANINNFTGTSTAYYQKIGNIVFVSINKSVRATTDTTYTSFTLTMPFNVTSVTPGVLLGSGSSISNGNTTIVSVKADSTSTVLIEFTSTNTSTNIFNITFTYLLN